MTHRKQCRRSRWLWHTGCCWLWHLCLFVVVLLFPECHRNELYWAACWACCLSSRCPWVSGHSLSPCWPADARLWIQHILSFPQRTGECFFVWINCGKKYYKYLRTGCCVSLGFCLTRINIIIHNKGVGHTQSRKEDCSFKLPYGRTIQSSFLFKIWAPSISVNSISSQYLKRYFQNKSVSVLCQGLEFSFWFLHQSHILYRWDVEERWAHPTAMPQMQRE